MSNLYECNSIKPNERSITFGDSSLYPGEGIIFITIGNIGDHRMCHLNRDTSLELVRAIVDYWKSQDV